jgi:hypothetical protein
LYWNYGYGYVGYPRIFVITKIIKDGINFCYHLTLVTVLMMSDFTLHSDRGSQTIRSFFFVLWFWKHFTFQMPQEIGCKLMTQFLQFKEIQNKWACNPNWRIINFVWKIMSMYYSHCRFTPFTRRVQHIEAASKMDSWIADPRKMKRWSAKEQGDGNKELGV